MRRVPGYWKNVDNQRQFLNKFFIEKRLSTFEDWVGVSRHRLIRNGAERIVICYSGELNRMFSNVYPNYPWNFSETKFKKKRFWCNQENQKKFMDALYEKLQLRSLDDWLKLTKNTIHQNGGQSLVKYYKNNYPQLLRTLYPNHLWEFSNIKDSSKEYWRIEQNIREHMENIFKKMDMITMDDWLKVSKTKIIQIKGGKPLLKHYANDMKRLLSSVYPNYPWNFLHLKYDPENLRREIKQQLCDIQSKYNIMKKDEWYRLRLYQNYSLIHLLKVIHPKEEWNKSDFLIHNKKTNQKLLHSHVSKLFPQYFCYENYLHPLICNAKAFFEFDIFIPSLNIVLEYQGEQHYDDIHCEYNQVSSYKVREEEKEKLASRIGISTLKVPFWWDRSYSTIITIFQSSHLLRNM